MCILAFLHACTPARACMMAFYVRFAVNDDLKEYFMKFAKQNASTSSFYRNFYLKGTVLPSSYSGLDKKNGNFYDSILSEKLEKWEN